MNPTIAFDIDGVLNRYGLHFCMTFEGLTGRRIDYERITSLPVTECLDVSVSWKELVDVFNRPEFWVGLPTSDGASDCLMDLSRSGFRIEVFTDRIWPFLDNLAPRDADAVRSKWSAFGYTNEDPGHSMREITRRWLHENSILCDGLHVLDSRKCEEDDRMVFCANYSVDVFVEDNLETANKLAPLVSKVIVIDRPWNRFGRSTCDGNIEFCKDLAAVKESILSGY